MGFWNLGLLSMGSLRVLIMESTDFFASGFSAPTLEEPSRRMATLRLLARGSNAVPFWFCLNFFA